MRVTPPLALPWNAVRGWYWSCSQTSFSTVAGTGYQPQYKQTLRCRFESAPNFHGPDSNLPHYLKVGSGAASDLVCYLLLVLKKITAWQRYILKEERHRPVLIHRGNGRHSKCIDSRAGGGARLGMRVRAQRYSGAALLSSRELLYAVRSAGDMYMCGYGWG